MILNSQGNTLRKVLPLNLVNRFTGSLVVDVAVQKILEYSIMAYRITYRKNYNPIQFIEGFHFLIISHILALHGHTANAQLKAGHCIYRYLKIDCWISLEFLSLCCVRVCLLLFYRQK